MALMDIFKRKTDKGVVLSTVEDIFNSDRDVNRRIMERIWWRNLLYYVGEQWIEWLRGTNTFRRRTPRLDEENPVSNEVRDYIKAVKAMLMNHKVVPKLVPSTNEMEDQMAAELGENLLIWMDSLDGGAVEDEKEKVIISYGMWGTGFLRTIPNKDGGEWFVHKDGTVLTTGDVTTENAIPFNVYVDQLGDTLRKKRYVGVQTMRDKKWVEDTFKVTGLKSDPVTAVEYQRKLMTLVSQVSPWKGFGVEYAPGFNDTDFIMFKEVEFRPSKEYPEGRYVIVCGGQTLVDIPRMPIKAEKGQWQYSLVDFHFNLVPGRFWSDSGVDDIISPQNTINDIDKALKQNRVSLGRTTVMSPADVSLRRLSERGDQVLVIQYDGMSTGGARPVIKQGTPLPNQTLEERALQKRAIQDRTGDPKNILAGEAPSAHASGKMTQTLLETAERGHYPDIDRHVRSMCRVYKCRLLVAKEIYTEERMIKVGGTGNKYKVVKFKSSDLRNNTDVRLEPDSGLATTQAEKRDSLMDLHKAGIFNAQITDPFTRKEMLRLFGFSGFTDPNNVDVDRAEMENAAVLSGHVERLMVVPPGPDGRIDPNSRPYTDDPLFKYDNHQVHFETHRRFILLPEFADLPLMVQAAMVHHTDLHNLLVQAAKAQQMKEAMMMAMGNRRQGGGAGKGNGQEAPQPLSGAESGEPAPGGGGPMQ